MAEHNANKTGDLPELPGQKSSAYRDLFEHMAAASCLDELIYRDGKAVDYRILEVNASFERITGISRARAAGSLASELYGIKDVPYLDIFSRVAKTGEPVRINDFFPQFGKYLDMIISRPREGCFSTVFTDITEQRKAQEALRISESKLSAALKMARAGHWEYDVESDTFTFNDNFYRIFHTTAEQVGGYQMSSANYARRFCHPDDAAMVGEEVRKAIESDDPGYYRQIEHRILFADGGVGYMSVCFFIVKDRTGRTIRTYGVNQDITDRKQTEEELRESEELYRAFINSTEDLAFIKDDAFRYQVVNRACARFFQRAANEIFGSTDAEMMPPEAAARCRMTDRQALETGQVVVSEEQVGDQVFETRKFPVRLRGGRVGVGGVIRNITERKITERTLKSERDFSTTVIETLPGIFYCCDENLQILRWNRNFERVTGYTAEEISRLSALDLFTGTERNLVALRIREVFEKGESEVTADLSAKDGTRIPYYFTGRVAELDGRRCLAGVGMDETAVRQARKAGEESKARYDLLFENSLDAMLFTAPDGRIFSANRAACRMFGMSEQEIVRAGRESLVDSSDPELGRLLKERETTGSASGIITMVRKDGSKFPAEISSSIFREENGELRTSIVIRDISARDRKDRNIHSQLDELRRWREVTMGREMRILELKQEVNELLSRAGLPPRYSSAGEQNTSDSSAREPGA